MLTITFSTERARDARPLALPIAKDEAIDGLVPADIADIVKAAAVRFNGESGSIADLHARVDGCVRRLLLVGTGTDAAADQAGGAIVAKLLTSGESDVVIDLTALPVDARSVFAARFAQAAMLRSWRLDQYRTKLPAKQKPTLQSVEIVVGDDVAAAEAAWTPLRAAAEGAALTRALVTEPPNILYPETFVERCRDLADLGIEIEVLDEAQMRELGMGALLGVSQGSEREARLLCLRWDGTGGAADPIALVGKGVTFDSGGISLKPGLGMEDMKWDMGGAGAVAGTMKALALRKAKAHVIGVCGLVENMPDGNAQRPGDVVSTRSGLTVEIGNTDAEGRLVLCDAIWWVQQKYKPKTIIDLATLTGAMVISLGHEHGGLFANDDALAEQILTAGKAVNEKLWRMPMGEAYDKLIDSPIADIKNIGPREAGSITAAQFIARFVDEGVKWAHLDIAGMAWAAKPGVIWEKGATGYGVRLLDQWVKDVLEQ